MNEIISKNLNKILACIRQNHNLQPSEVKKLTEACDFLEQNLHPQGHMDTVHALNTALFVAENRFDYKVVLAALLHDFAAEQLEEEPLSQLQLNSKTVQILQVFRNIHESLISSCHRQGIDVSLKQEFYYTEALFIKISEMIALMEASESIASEEQLLEITHSVKHHLIPEAKKIRAFMLVDKLESLCLKIERNDLYTAIQSKLEEMEQLNRPNHDRIFTQFQQIFDKHSRILPKSLIRNEQKYIKEIRWGIRSVSSIARHLEKHTTTLPYDFDRLMDKRMMPCRDITLIVEDSIADSKLCPKDIFFNYYDNYLVNNCKIYILGYYETTYRDSNYFVLCDDMNNLYRIFIKTEEEYLCYQLGTNIEKNNFRLNYSSLDDNQIKVFKKDGTATTMEDGATVLDFAFKIHESVGLHFAHALLNNKKRPCPAYTRLTNGDSVNIITDSKVVPDLQWFKYLKTDLAINKLIKYFKNQELSSGTTCQ